MRALRERENANMQGDGIGPSRRGFLVQGAGLGLAALVPPALTGCFGGGNDDTPAPAPAPGSRPTHQATLFFNLSHENHAGRTYHLTGGGRRVTLTRVADKPEVLAAARAGNAFLRGVPDEHITHHVEGATFASDSTTLCYVSADLDAQAGTWSMSSVQLYIPPSGATRAFAARRQWPSGTLPLSAKRERYGLPPAGTERDLLEERMLLDSASHAATLVGCHPDLLCLEPGGAHTIQANHLDQNRSVKLLGEALSQPNTKYGAATPEQQPGQPNASGWATLRPVPDDDGTPLRNKSGQHAGRMQYMPDLHPELRQVAGQAMNSTSVTVKNDTSLGTDATGLAPTNPENPALAGMMWMRHDGMTKIDQSADAQLVRDGDGKMTLSSQTWANDWQVMASSSGQQVSLTILNFFASFRGVYLQFFDNGDTPLNLSSIPEYAAGTIVANHDKNLDTATDMFVSVLGPVFLVLGIPTAPGFIQPKFNVPAGATKVRILSSTLSFQANNNYPETVLPGAVMTGVINYGTTAMLCALGSAPLIPVMMKAVVMPLLQTLTLEIVTIISAALNPNGDKSLVGEMTTPGFWISQALVVGKMLVTSAAGAGMKALVGFIAAAVTEGAAEDAVPLAGEVMLAISIAAGVSSLAETTADLALLPWTVVDDLVFTHDLRVKLQPDPNNSTFPKAANAYEVTALFDNAAPFVQRFDLPAAVPATLPDVVFSSVPLGGQVNVTVAFLQKASVVGQTDIVLGKGTTGLIANDAAAAPTLQIEEIAFPIDATTAYQHKLKTTLDALGNHIWSAAPAPAATLANVSCGGAGTACAYRAISVRQGTSVSRGYVGYAWQSQNSDGSVAPSCVGGGVAQLDQLANLGTDSGNAQLGYANGSCGIGVPGVKVAYSLLNDDARNFYLDTTDADAPVVRQVVLGNTPSFAPPGSGQAWGVLNFASDTLLLHPAGHLVSINTAFHKLETHRLPPASMADADARLHLVATVQSGQGSRPGLVNSPVAAAVSRDGVVLVLEIGNNRIQALDLGANPVRHFKQQSSPYSLTLAATDPVQGWQYLDLAVEYTGFVYVLAYNQNTFVYRLDIYHPDQSGTAPICTTHNVNAARLTVDLWRSVYTLNYEVLQLPGGAPAPLTEPSVSLWTPCSAGRTC